MITASIVADSVALHGGRITTFSLEYPRFVHAEVMTHRVFSRSAASNRAIPVQKVVERVQTMPALPTHWGCNQKGMQADEELTGAALFEAQELWGAHREYSCRTLLELSRLGLHKQVANRLVEAHQHIAVVLTATDFGNWFNLRYHPKAQPEIAQLAAQMWHALQNSVPVSREHTWHLPYITEEERQTQNDQLLLKMSAARCARVSYYNHEGKTPALHEDLALYNRLMSDMPKHASPTEHQAWPIGGGEQSGNFTGWRQFRKTIDGENMPTFAGPVVL